MPRRRGDSGALESRFLSRIVKSGSCWTWGNGQYNHYPQVFSHRRAGKRTYISAHRLSWMIHHGRIPSDRMVLHRCDNRRCVNPDHLFLGTTSDNLRDCAKKGRHFSQTSRFNPAPFRSNAKLKPCEVQEIRRLRSLGVSGMLLAKLFPVVSFVQIYNICRRTSWRAV